MLYCFEWNTMESQIEVPSLILFYKIKLALPNYIQANTRLIRSNDLKLIQPSTNTNIYKHSFFPAAIRVWNSLPANIVHVDSANTLKFCLCHL